MRKIIAHDIQGKTNLANKRAQGFPYSPSWRGAAKIAAQRSR